MKKSVVTITLFLIIFSLYQVLSSIDSRAKNSNPIPQTLSDTATGSAIFAELTVPYLRQRTYQSQLSQLKKHSETNTYTSYLTDYTSDNLKINALLTIPKGNPPENGWPAVVFIHGYIPPNLYQTTRNYSSYVDGLAKNEIVVFKVDLRGHGKSEGDPSGAYYSSDYVIDTLNAVSAISTHNSVNKNKISLWGHSMAGNIIMRSIVSSPEIYKAVIWAGAGYTYTDLTQYRINDTSYRPPALGSTQQRRRKELFDTYGQFSTKSDFWIQVPPTNYLEGLTTKVQLHHATDDKVVSINYSKNLHQILTDSKIESELFEYPSGGHNLTGTTFTKAMNETINFLKN